MHERRELNIQINDKEAFSANVRINEDQTSHYIDDQDLTREQKEALLNLSSTSDFYTIEYAGASSHGVAIHGKSEGIKITPSPEPCLESQSPTQS